VRKYVYDLVNATLMDSAFLDSLAPSVVRAQYIRPISHTLLFSPESDPVHTTPGAVTATVAIAAASVSFVVASIFCYGLLRREIRYHPEPSIRHRGRSKNGRQIVANPKGIRSRQHPFVRLADFPESLTDPTSFITSTFASTPRESAPSITWSISDITSDSASARSSLSRRTSNLERIEEEDEESDDEYETVSEDLYDDQSGEFYQGRAPIAQMYGLSPIKYTAENFFQELRPDMTELQGCQFVEDIDGYTSPVDDLQVSDDALTAEPLPSLLDGVHSWNIRSPTADTEDDVLYLESEKEMMTSLSSATIHHGTKGESSERIRYFDETILPETNSEPSTESTCSVQNASDSLTACTEDPIIEEAVDLSIVTGDFAGDFESNVDPNTPERLNDEGPTKNDEAESSVDSEVVYPDDENVESTVYETNDERPWIDKYMMTVIICLRVHQHLDETVSLSRNI
jgi:hypothetical protein